MVLPLQEFLWRADNHWFISRGPTSFFNLGPQGCIREMLTVPGQQVLYAVGDGNCNVERVFGPLLRYCPCGHQLLSKSHGLFGHRQQGQRRQYIEPFLCCFWVASACLSNDQLGGDQVESVTACLPPVSGNFLMPGSDHVLAGTG